MAPLVLDNQILVSCTASNDHRFDHSAYPSTNWTDPSLIDYHDMMNWQCVIDPNQIDNHDATNKSAMGPGAN